MSHGVKKIASIVETRVKLTDSAKFAFAKKTTTLDAVPPGQQDTKIKPTAISDGN